MQAYDVDRNSLQIPFEENSDIDTVLHLATCYGRQNEKDLEIFESNTSFPLKLLEIAIFNKIKSFINTDTSLPRTLNAYTMSKKQFVEWGEMYAQHGKLCFVNIILEHFYGPGDDKTKFISWVVESCLKNITELKLTLDIIEKKV